MPGFQTKSDAGNPRLHGDAARLMQEIQRRDALSRTRNGGSMDGATMALRRVAEGLIMKVEGDPKQMDKPATQQELRKCTVLMATERLMSFGENIEIAICDSDTVVIYNPEQEDDRESFSLRLLDFDFT